MVTSVVSREENWVFGGQQFESVPCNSILLKSNEFLKTCLCKHCELLLSPPCLLGNSVNTLSVHSILNFTEIILS